MSAVLVDSNDVTSERVRRIQIQAIDKSLSATFLKTVHSIPLPGGGALSVVRKRLFPEIDHRGVVLLVHGFGQNRYTWHTPHRSFVNYLAFRGYDVFNLELRGFGRSGQFGSRMPDHPDVHFEVDVPTAVEAVRHLVPTDRVFLIGHSLGGACAYAAAPFVERSLRGVVTLAGLYRFAPVWGIMAVVSWLATALERTGRPSDVVLPVQHVGRLFGSLNRVMNSRVYRPIPLQPWYPGTIEEPVLSYINKWAYDRASLGVALAIAWWGRLGRVTGRSGRDYLGDFDRLDLPLLVLAGSHDVLIPPSGVKPAYENSQSHDKAFRVFGPNDGGHHWGHVDLILGTDASGYVWPTVADWLDRH